MKEPYEKAKETIDLVILKKANRQVVEECVGVFRKEAMSGQDGSDMVAELEMKLRDSLREKYQELKREINNQCKQKARKCLDEQV